MVRLSQLTSTNIIAGIGVALMGLIFIMGLGISWTFLLAVTTFGVFNVYSGLKDGKFENANSFENIYSLDDGHSKRKRLLAKKMEKYEKRRTLKASSGNMEEEGIQHSSQDGAGSDIFQDPDFSLNSIIEDYNGVFANSLQTSSEQVRKRSIPSLRSPQPLLSAFNMRFGRRERNQQPTQCIFDKTCPLSPRSVFDTSHNRMVGSPLNTSWTVKEAQLFGNKGIESYKAMSPPSGRYFSRINENFEQNSTMMSEKMDLQAFEKVVPKDSLPTILKLDDSCSKEAVVKALQEKTASKRKRPPLNLADTPDDQQETHNKKRRVENDVLDSTIDNLHCGNMKENIKQRFMQRSLGSRPALKKTIEVRENDDGNGEDGENEHSQPNKKKTKFGMNEKELESISIEQDDMEVDSKQTKRKAETSTDLRAKGKKNRKDKDVIKTKTNKESDSKGTQSKITNSTKKKTPVRTVETQTPTKLTTEKDSSISVQSPKTPKQKTPYKKVFTSGFPSNLKPGTTEKRRRIPIYCGSIGDIEAIEIAREEYGVNGVSIDAFKAEKKAESDRVNELLDGKDDNEDETTTVSIAKSSTATVKDQTQSTSSAISLSSTNFNITSATLQTTELPKAGGISFANNLTDLTKSSQSQTAAAKLSFQPSTLQFNQPSLSVAPSLQANNTPASTQSKPQGGFSFGLPTVTSQSTATTTTNGLLSALSGGDTNAKTSSTSAVISQATTAGISFGAPQGTTQPSLSGFQFAGASTSTANAPVASVAAPSFGFGQGTISASQPSATQPSAPAATATTQSVNLLQSGLQGSTLLAQTQASAPALGGFSFGASAAQKQDPPKLFGNTSADSASVLSAESDAATAMPSGGFSFGTSALGTATGQFGTATLGTTANQKASSISFGASPAAATGRGAVSQQSKPSSGIGGFNFGATVTSTTSFGTKSLSPPKTTAVVPPTSAAFGGFKFGASATNETKPGGFAFGQAATRVTPAQANAGQSLFGTNPPNASTASIFQTPSTQTGVPSVFGTPASSASVSTNLFGTPNATPQKAPPPFGANQAGTQNQQAPLFGTPTSTASVFGAPTQAASGTSSIFGAPTQPVSTAASIFGAPSQGASVTGSIFGAPVPNTTTTASIFGAQTSSSTGGSLFGASAQTAPQSGSIFGAQAQPASSASVFGAPATSSTFSFGGQSTNIFGSTAAPAQTSAATGGFSFGANTQASSGTSKPPAFGQAPATQNPFGGGSVFGQPSSVPQATTTTGFTFSSGSQPAFGQSGSGQPAFGSSSTSAFGSTANKGQSGGFNFTAALQPQAGAFSFGGAGGASSGGFTSRPGTPTPFGNAQAGGNELFSNPQPQAGGFSMGSGVTSRPTARGRRRVPRR